MAEKMFAHQISERGLADVVRVTSAGTGGWHAGEPADRRAGHVLRATATRRRTAPPRSTTTTSAADLVVALGRNHLRMLQHEGVPAERLRMLRSFDPRSGAHAQDVEDPYYGTQDDFEDVFTVIEAALPGLHGWVDERLAERGWPADADGGLSCCDRTGWRCSSWSSPSPTCASPCWRRGSSARTPRPPVRTTRSPTH